MSSIGKNLAAALLVAQKQIDTAIKSAENSYFKKADGSAATYAPLEAIIDAVKPALNANGIVFVQSLSTPPFEGHLALTTTLIHAESGEILSDTAVVPLAKQDPQGFGSAVTYTRRYGLASLVGLKTENDDDGNAASTPGVKKPQPTSDKKPAGGFRLGGGNKPAAEGPKAPPKGKTGLFPAIGKGKGGEANGEA